MDNILNNAINYCIGIYENDLNKLETLSIEKLYFSPRVTNKHIYNLKQSFEILINNIENENDIINLFSVSTVNTKLNKSDKKINTISIAPYYLCNNLLNNNCNNSNICYGAKNEMFKNVLKYRLKNYIFFNILEYLYNNDYLKYKKVLYNAIDLNKKLITDIIRINQQSDIKNNTILYILNDILNYIKVYYNKDCIFYTYTKTKNLNYNMLNKDFIINKSIPIIYNENDLLKYENENNIFITIDKNIKFEDIPIKNKYLCKNNCSICENCFKKNKHITLCYKH